MPKKQKKKWLRPNLLVLLRDNSQAVLLGCKRPPCWSCRFSSNVCATMTYWIGNFSYEKHPEAVDCLDGRWEFVVAWGFYGQEWAKVCPTHDMHFS